MLKGPKPRRIEERGHEESVTGDGKYDEAEILSESQSDALKQESSNNDTNENEREGVEDLERR